MFDEIIKRTHHEVSSNFKKTDKIYRNKRIGNLLTFVLFFIILSFEIFIIATSLSIRVKISLQIINGIFYYVFFYTSVYYKILYRLKELLQKLRNKCAADYLFLSRLFYWAVIMIFIVILVLFLNQRFLEETVKHLATDNSVVGNISIFVTTLTGVIVTLMIFILGNFLERYPNLLAKYIFSSFNIMAPIIISIAMILINLLFYFDEPLLMNQTLSFQTAIITIVSLFYLIWMLFKLTEVASVINYCGNVGARKIKWYLKVDSFRMVKFKYAIINIGYPFISLKKNNVLAINLENNQKLSIIFEAFIHLAKKGLDENNKLVFKSSMRNVSIILDSYINLRKQYIVHDDNLLAYLNQNFDTIFEIIKRGNEEDLYSDIVDSVRFIIVQTTILACENQNPENYQGFKNSIAPRWIAYYKKVFKHTYTLNETTAPTEIINNLFLIYRMCYKYKNLGLISYPLNPVILEILDIIITESRGSYSNNLYYDLLESACDSFFFILQEKADIEKIHEILYKLLESIPIFVPYPNFQLRGASFTFLSNEMNTKKSGFITCSLFLLSNSNQFKKQYLYNTFTKIIENVFLIIKHEKSKAERIHALQGLYSIIYILINSDLESDIYDSFFGILYNKIENYLSDLNIGDRVGYEHSDDLRFIISLFALLLIGNDNPDDKLVLLVSNIYLVCRKREKARNLSQDFFGYFQIFSYVINESEIRNRTKQKFENLLKRNYAIRETNMIGFFDSYQKLSLPEFEFNTYFSLTPLNDLIEIVKDKEYFQRYIEVSNKIEVMNIMKYLYSIYELDEREILIRKY